MSDFAVSPSLLLASLDLNLVTSVIQAIRTADLSSAAVANSGGAAARATSENQPSITTAAVTKTIRNCDQPAATFERCPVPHWQPRLNALQAYECTRPVLPADCRPIIQPPWKVLPWPIQAKAICASYHRSIKVKANYTDVGSVGVDSVGRTLDLFI